MMLVRPRIAALVVLVALSACTTTRVDVAEDININWTTEQKRVLLVEPDVQLGELTAGGTFEPRADWTQSAQRYITREASRIMRGGAIDLVQIDKLEDPREFQLTKLHGAVGQAALVHLFTPGMALPNKTKAMDWTLGPGTNIMRDRYDADYALFMYVRDSYTTAGRAFLMVGAAMFGVGVQGGTQVGYTSLVDLRTGDVIWFNLLTSSGGDLRTAEPAREVVQKLLEGLPL
ncbi:MAG: hypothetical protein GKS03_01495 [Alphaproteobacteria bacterium]|nr:hypothetical protein [Alphaproteobacteria bacterium]